jgi:hypothetical protein
LATRINALATRKKLPNRESRIKTRHRVCRVGNAFSVLFQARFSGAPLDPDSLAGNGGGAALGGVVACA